MNRVRVKNLMWIPLVTLLILNLCPVVPSKAQEDLYPADVSIQPSSISWTYPEHDLLETFEVTLYIHNVTDLWGWQAGLYFNPDVLNVTYFEEGPFLKQGGITWWMPGTINNTAGVITLYGVSLTGAPWVDSYPQSGSGDLAYIGFQVINYGNSTLDLTTTYDDPAELILVDSSISEIPCDVYDGYFELPPPVPPVASFTYSPEHPIVGESVTFNASLSSPEGGYIISYLWDFGDDSPLVDTTDPITYHAYNEPGTYNMTLTVTDSEGLSDSFTDSVTIYVPGVSYSDSTVVTQGTEVTDHTLSHASDDSWYQIDTEGVTWYYIDVQMIFYTTVDPTTLASITVFSEAHVADPLNPVDVNIYDYVNLLWVPCFSVSASTDANHTKTFTANLSNYINVTAAEMRLQMYYKVKVVQSIYQDHTYIEPTAEAAAPVASFTYSPSKPIVNEGVTFDASSSTPDGGQLIDPDGYAWDFETDGVIDAYGKIVNQTYTAADTYNVTLIVTNSDDFSNNTWQEVTIYDVHDVAVVDVTPSATEAYPTWTEPLNITVVVMNEGTATETFNVTVYAYNTTYNITYQIGTQTVTDLAPGANTTLPPFSWVLTDVAHHVVYTVIANASVVSGETDTADNTLIDGTVFIKIPGDANGDGAVNVSDLGRLGLAWGSSVGDPNYDPQCDFNGDGTINISDPGIMGLWWGYTA